MNQYVEVAAKNNKCTNLNKGFEWAQFLDINIRWLRDKEPTKENLEYVYTSMKKAVYISL